MLADIEQDAETEIMPELPSVLAEVVKGGKKRSMASGFVV